MKSRTLIIGESAKLDLLDLEIWLESAAGKMTARRYVDRLVAFFSRLDLAAERGSLRNDILPGLRIIGFERRVTIAFVVLDQTVEIVRIFQGGRDWEAEFSDD